MKKFRIKLERYNQIVWAVIGSGALLIAAISVIVAVIAMFPSGQRGVPVEVVEGDPENTRATADLRVDICPPIPVDGTPYQLIGVAVDRIVIKNRALLAKKAKGFASSYSDEASLGGCGYHGEGSMAATGNVLIRDTRTGAMRPLLAQNALVQHMEYPVRPVNPAGRHAFPPPEMLYWEIGMGDTNGDGVLDERDDIGAYLSDIDGTKLARITPPGSRVVGKTYDETRRRLYLKIVQDTDGNKTLDDNDSSALIEVDVAHRRIVGTILDARRWQEQSRGLKPLNVLP
jgi:hypothetical protein